MSTRASLLADSDGDLVEVGESVSWIPLLWVSLLSSADLDQLSEGTVITKTAGAIQRCSRAVPFLKGLFPEFAMLEQVAEDFVGLLRRSKANSISLEFVDHLGMNPELFPPAFEAAVKALEAQNAKASFTVPARTEPLKRAAVKLKSARDVLCLAASLNPLEEDEETERDQLIGYLSLEDYSRKQNTSKKQRKLGEKPVNYRNKKCPKCGEPLRTNSAKQCFSCGANWHK